MKYTGNSLDLLDNLVSIDRKSRSFNGVTIEDTHERHRGHILHELVQEGQTGLTINLTEIGGHSEPRLKPDQACTIDHRPNHMALIPKGMRMWGYSELTYNHYAVLFFDVPTLERNFGEEFVAQVFLRPKLRFADARIHALVRMIIDIDPSDASAQLLGDSLTSAIFAILSAEAGEVREERKLPNWQVKRVIEYMREQLPRQIELAELANIVGHSQWHFARAFKAATGQSPYQWQLEQRINLAKSLLLESDMPLEAIAETTGFNDSMHLIRAFKRRVGEPPGAWRRARK